MRNFCAKIFLILFFLTSCSQYKVPWTDKKHGELWKNRPNDISESLAWLDTMLSASAKNQFITTDEPFAVVEISEQLGQIFISRWRLAKEINKSNLRSCFYQMGITDPAEMIRIIFTCYHRKMNYHSYDINNIIQQYQSYWVNSSIYPESNYPRLNPGIKALDDSITNKFFFDIARINDTLSASLFYSSHRLTPMPLRYDVETVVLEKNRDEQTLTVNLTKISSSDNETDSLWYDLKTKRKLGDTFEIKAAFMQKKGAHRPMYL
jgi:hypothetical protein